jgi:hypothetical protein
MDDRRDAVSKLDAIDAELCEAHPVLAKHRLVTRQLALRAVIATWPEAEGEPDFRQWQRAARLWARGYARTKGATIHDEEGEDEYLDFPAPEEGKVGFAIMGVIAMALLSWLIQKLADWLYERWKKNHPPAPPQLVALQHEANQ